MLRAFNRLNSIERITSNISRDMDVTVTTGTLVGTDNTTNYYQFAASGSITVRDGKRYQPTRVNLITTTESQQQKPFFYTIVAGGGGGGTTSNQYTGRGGGGGAGGVRGNFLSVPAPIRAPVTPGEMFYSSGNRCLYQSGNVISVTIGSFGSQGVQGSPSSLSLYGTSYTVHGGGYGGPYTATGGSGGSGGGGGGTAAAGSGNSPPVSPPQGNSGGQSPGSPETAGGGGGFTAAASVSTGGAGFTLVVGTGNYPLGGGGGGGGHFAEFYPSGPPHAGSYGPGPGPNGGGQNGGGSGGAGGGSANTGGGGGGAGTNGAPGGSGGSGVAYFAISKPTAIINYSNTTDFIRRGV